MARLIAFLLLSAFLTFLTLFTVQRGAYDQGSFLRGLSKRSLTAVFINSSQYTDMSSYIFLQAGMDVNQALDSMAAGWHNLTFFIDFNATDVQGTPSSSPTPEAVEALAPSKAEPSPLAPPSALNSTPSAHTSAAKDMLGNVSREDSGVLWEGVMNKVMSHDFGPQECPAKSKVVRSREPFLTPCYTRLHM